MKKLILAVAVSVLALLGLSGCVVHTHAYVGHPNHATVWVVERGHVHSDHCGHYWHENRWYVWSGHRHGPGCGHAYRGGRWEVDVNVRVH